MAQNSSSGFKQDTNFVWADLSSYDTRKARTFYEKVFRWQTYDMGKMAAEPDDRFGMADVSYYVATQDDQPAAGIFDMPPFFQKIKMPSFWMSYLAVDDIEAVVARAKTIEGSIIDVEPTPFGDGMMALIRDPLGAGFTCYDGPSINAKTDGSIYGRMVWNELITSSIPAVSEFYQKVLGLSLIPDDSFSGKRVKVLNPEGEEIAGIQEVDEALRSKKVYWVPFFSVDSFAEFNSRVEAAGGQPISGGSFGGSALYYDNQEAGFGAAETGTSPKDASWWSKLGF